jgi:hypothetical protein
MVVVTESEALKEAMAKLEKATSTIRRSRHGRTRPVGGVDIHDPRAVTDRLEDALLAVEEVLKELAAKS